MAAPSSSAGKAAAGSGEDPTKTFWLASDFDDPLDVALVYNKVDDTNSTKGGGKCGHALRWDPLIRSLESRERSTCPICNEPIALICDGLVASLSSTSSEKDNAIKEANSFTSEIKPPQIVTFKYGKQVYRLSIPPPANSTTTTTTISTAQQNPVASTTATAINLIRWSVSFLVPFAQQQQDHKNNDDHFQSTAQYRIAQALGMHVEHGIKILHKGKILYPIPASSTTVVQSSTSTTTTTTKKTIMMDLSKRLVKIAELDWESPSSSSNKKPTLVVMGTRSGSEVFGRNKDNGTDFTSMARNLLGMMILIPFRILHFSITWVLDLVGTIVQPLLPQQQQRPHQD